MKGCNDQLSMYVCKNVEEMEKKKLLKPKLVQIMKLKCQRK